MPIKIPGMNTVKAARHHWLIGPIILLVISFGGGWLGARYYSEHGSTASTRYVSDESQLISKIAKDVGQSVVSINVESQQSAVDIFGNTFPQTQVGAGTGFVIRSDGIIVTNRHVVPAGTTNVTVTLADGTKFTNVDVLGRTSENSSLDVAFLKIKDLKGHKLPAVKFGDSSKVNIGDRVIAIGNALGQFQNTVTEGIISGFGRQVTAGDQSGSGSENLTDLFQTDAAINPGNSGGPLVDVNGEVIGLNTAVAGNAQNIGFSIPVNDIQGLIKGILSTGKVEQPYLGVHYVSLTADLAYQYNLNVKNGAYILPTSSSNPSSIVSGSPADKAGLKEKDVITKINDISLDDRTSLSTALSRFQPGDRVTLTVVRGGQTITLQVALDKAPGS